MPGKIDIVAAPQSCTASAPACHRMVDQGCSDRMPHALTRRIALSVALIVPAILAIRAGWIQPHRIDG